MDDKLAQMAGQLGKDPAALQALLRSRDAQALMQMLSQGDQGASLQRAARSAARGDTGELKRMMDQLMHTPDGAKLLQRLSQNMQK